MTPKTMNTQTETALPVGSSALLGLARMSKHWPATYRDRIPVKVRMAQDLGPDMWAILGRGTPRIWVEKDAELPVVCNQHGAISVVTPYGNLGVKPLECDIIEWREPNESERPNAAGELRPPQNNPK